MNPGKKNKTPTTIDLNQLVIGLLRPDQANRRNRIPDHDAESAITQMSRLANAANASHQENSVKCLTPPDELRSYQTGSRPSGLVGQSRKLRTRDSSITHATSALKTGW